LTKAYILRALRRAAPSFRSIPEERCPRQLLKAAPVTSKLRTHFTSGSSH